MPGLFEFLFGQMPAGHVHEDRKAERAMAAEGDVIMFSQES